MSLNEEYASSCTLGGSWGLGFRGAYKYRDIWGSKYPKPPSRDPEHKFFRRLHESEILNVLGLPW